MHKFAAKICTNFMCHVPQFCILGLTILAAMEAAGSPLQIN